MNNRSRRQSDILSRNWKVGFSTLALVACGGATEPAPPRSIGVFNFLTNTIHVAAAGSNFGTVSSGGHTAITIPADITTIQVALDPQRYNDNSPIPSDLGTFTVAITAAGEVDVSNVLGGVTYFTPRIGNSSGVTVDIAVVQDATVQCLGSLSSGGVFSAAYGYYRLTSLTTMRVYRGGSNCTGASRQWTNAQLNAFEAKSGRVFLTADVAP